MKTSFRFVGVAVVAVCLGTLPSMARKSGRPPAAGPGDVIINEIMQNPAAVSDAAGEWFELHNTTAADIDIDGWTIEDNDIDSHVIDNGGPLVVPAGGFLVLGINADSSTNGGVTVDYSYGSSWFLANGADEIVLLDGSLTEIDRVEYDGGPGFPDPNGASMALESPTLDNNVGASWCTAYTPFGAGDFGTPGAANDCAVADPGDVIVNEIMQNPAAVSDSAGEWFEIYNLATGGVDIDGWTIADDDVDSHVIVNGGPLVVPAGGFLVLGNNADMATNGGVSVDYSYGSSWFLANGADEIVLLDGSLTEIDRVEYDGGPGFPDPTGASMALESPTLDNSDGANWCESSTAYGAGDLGTPGGANDCVPPVLTVTIMEIQGTAHRSPLEGQWVETTGVVTVTRSRGFYMQDATGDGDVATSDGIFVFTGSAPTVGAGDLAEVTGRVTEFYAGGYATGNLSTTELTDPTAVTLSSGNPLPSATIVGSGGRIPPAMVIDDDAAGDVESPPATFDPTDDGIDFYESLEGMLVRVNEARVVGSNLFGEIAVVGDDGGNAGLLTPRGGIVVRPDDFNPERIIIDDAIVADEPTVTVGDSFDAPVSGVLDYDFANFKLLNFEPLPTVTSGELEMETTAAAVAGQLAVATLDVRNLDPGDDPAVFDALADQIVQNLQSPDIIGVQRIQDNSGPSDDGTIDASDTYGALISAVSAAGGPLYDYRDIAPLDNQDGGVPGGNIRVGLLYNPARVSFVDRPGGGATDATTPVLGTNGVELTYSPGRIDPTNSVFIDIRKSLAAEFEFEGSKIIVINNHFNSPAGDDPLFGRVQPPQSFSRPLRGDLAQVVNDFVDDILALDATADVIVLGTVHDFPFSATLGILAGGVLTDLVASLPANEQYNYVYDGNSEALDSFLVSGNLWNMLSAVDIVHVNAEFPDDTRPTDHDPITARFCVDTTPPNLEVTVSPDTLWSPNHEYVTVSAVVTVFDNSDPDVMVALLSSTSNEPDNGLGDGDMPNDIVIVDDFTFDLRAERSGTGDGRIYTITYQATDACGNSTVASATVEVPHDQDDDSDGSGNLLGIVNVQ